ncbi:MAG: DUF4303 domain-containing protein [Deltaproteobacteria bacterium]|nr:DUF4303 domain-containing protein [Deltaproteobacteria bacterium]
MAPRRKRDDTAGFAASLEVATLRGVRELLARIGGETLYALALYTSGETDLAYVMLSANTEEALARAAEGDPERARSMRFCAPDWGYHGADDLADAPLPEGSGGKRDRLILDAMARALRAVEREGLVGHGARRERVVLAVMCGDLTDEFFERGLARCNPASVVDAYRREHTCAGVVAEIEARPEAECIAIWLDLAENLALAPSPRLGRRGHVPLSSLAARLLAADVSASEYTAVRALGDHLPASADAIVSWLERYALSGPSGTDDGAWLARMRLGSGLVFEFERRFELEESIVERLARLAAARAHLDEGLEIATTLAENLARVLHHRQPKRFPRTQLDGKTNHLANARELFEAAGVPYGR